MKRLKIFLFFLILTTISVVVYFIFEVDIQAYLVTLFGDEKPENKTNPPTVSPIVGLVPNFIIQPPTVSPVTPPVPIVTTPVIIVEPPTPPTNPPTPTPKPVSTANGEAVFNYLEISNGQPLPTDGKPQANGYIKCSFPSHSRVCTPVPSTPQNSVAYCEYGVRNSAGQDVVYVKDTIGGFHPNFFDAGQRSQKGNDFYKWVDDWAAAFKPFGVFTSFNDRTNNHFDTYKKYLKEGSYTFWYRNLSNTRHTVTAGYIRASNAEGVCNVIVEPNSSFEKVFTLASNGDEWDDFKFNTNNYYL